MHTAMIDRSDLEIRRSPTEMHNLLSVFAEDRETYPDEDVHLKRGVIKDLLEEYAPLCTLCMNIPGVLAARLAPQSNEGPDAIVELQSSQEFREISVQITVANQSYQTSLARERFSQGLPDFANTEKRRNPANKSEIQKTGRILTTKEARLRRQVAEVISSVEKKLKKYHPGTEVLLIATRIWLDDSAIAYSWRDDLKQRIDVLARIQYRCIYLANGDGELLTLFEFA